MAEIKINWKRLTKGPFRDKEIARSLFYYLIKFQSELFLFTRKFYPANPFKHGDMCGLPKKKKPYSCYQLQGSRYWWAALVSNQAQPP